MGQHSQTRLFVKHDFHDTMTYQFFPFLALFTMWGINVVKKRFLCMTSLVLFMQVVFFGFSLSAPDFLYFRYGGLEPSFSAMLLLSAGFTLLNLPLLSFNDNVASSQTIVYFPNFRSIKYPIIFICIQLFIAMILNLHAIVPTIKIMLQSVDCGAFDKNLLRESNDMMQSSNINWTVWLATPWKLALFLGIYGALSKKIPRMAVYSLLFGSIVGILVILKDGGRAGVVQYILFLSISIIFFLGFCCPLKRRCLLIIMVCLSSACLLTLFYISFIRFPYEAFFQMYHYLVAGPYFFSTDYIIYNECGVKPNYLVYGSVMFPLSQYLNSLFHGVEFINPAKQVMQDEFLMSLYQRIAGSFHVEFKTLIGNLFVDFSWNMIWILLLLLTIIGLFYRSSPRLRYSMLAVYYCCMMAFAPIGFIFSGPFGNIEILYFILFYFYLSVIEKINKNKINNMRLTEGTARCASQC